MMALYFKLCFILLLSLLFSLGSPQALPGDSHPPPTFPVVKHIISLLFFSSPQKQEATARGGLAFTESEETPQPPPPAGGPSYSPLSTPSSPTFAPTPASLHSPQPPTPTPKSPTSPPPQTPKSPTSPPPQTPKSPTSPPPRASPSPRTPESHYTKSDGPPSPSRRSKRLSGGQKAGIAIGVLAGSALIGFGGTVYMKRRNNIRRQQYAANVPVFL